MRPGDRIRHRFNLAMSRGNSRPLIGTIVFVSSGGTRVIVRYDGFENEAKEKTAMLEKIG